MKNISINKLKHKQVKPKLFMTMDIETMLKNKFQVPVTISLAYFDKEGLIKNKVVVIDPELLNKNEELAIKDLWSRFFDHLILSINTSYGMPNSKNNNYFNSAFRSVRINKSDESKLKTSVTDKDTVTQTPLIERKKKNIYIFMHNLGKFDGIYLIKGLLKIIHYNNVQTIINKENEFIEINAKIDNFKFIWKDSLRIFNVSLEELCEIFNSNTKKLHSYKPEYNHISLFNNPLLLEEFKQYSVQDSVSLLEALKIALYYIIYIKLS